MPDQYLASNRNEIRSILLDEEPDLVEICDKYALNWLAGLIRTQKARKRRRPVVVGNSCERMDDNVAAYLSDRETGRWLAQVYMRNFYLPMFDFHLANSEYTADELRRATYPEYRNRVVVCHPGVDVRAFDPWHRSESTRCSLLALAGGTPESNLILYVGRLSPEKNCPLLFEMLEHLRRASRRDYRLLIAGDGPSADDLAKSPMVGQAQFLGHITDRNRLAEIYASSDFFVHPNAREPFGIAPLEAMASGCPVVLPNAGGVLSYANSDNSWLGTPDAVGMCLALTEASLSPDERRHRAAIARATAEAHSWDRAADRLFGVYDSFVERFRAEEREACSHAWLKRPPQTAALNP